MFLANIKTKAEQLGFKVTEETTDEVKSLTVELELNKDIFVFIGVKQNIATLSIGNYSLSKEKVIKTINLSKSVEFDKQLTELSNELITSLRDYLDGVSIKREHKEIFKELNIVPLNLHNVKPFEKVDVPSLTESLSKVISDDKDTED